MSCSTTLLKTCQSSRSLPILNHPGPPLVHPASLILINVCANEKCTYTANKLTVTLKTRHVSSSGILPSGPGPPGL